MNPNQSPILEVTPKTSHDLTILAGQLEPAGHHIRARLMLIAMLATLLPAGLFGLSFLQERAGNVEVAMRNLEGVANSVVTSMSNNIQATSQLHYRLAQAMELDTNDRAACSSFLARILEAHPQYTGILTINPDGQLFCDSLNTGRVLDLDDRNYFKRALVGTNVSLDPVFGRLTGKAVLQIAYPARTELGALKFVLLASLNLDSLIQEHMSELPQAAYEVVITDSKGTVLVGTPPEGWKDYIGKTISDTQMFQYAHAHPEGGIAEVTGLDGSHQVWAFAEIPEDDVGLHVMVGMSRSAVLAGMNTQVSQKLTILVVLFIILFAGVSSLADRRIRKPAKNASSRYKQ